VLEITLLLLQRLVLSQQKWQQSEEYRVSYKSFSISLVDAAYQADFETNTAFENLLGLSSALACTNTLYVYCSGAWSIELNLQCWFRTIISQVNSNIAWANCRCRNQCQPFLMMAGIFCVRHRAKQLEKQLLHDAFHDSLTGLARIARYLWNAEPCKPSKTAWLYFCGAIFRPWSL